MLKTLIPVACPLAACGAHVSTAADLHFAEKLGGISHDLRIANLKADARGVPSFDYSYHQQRPGCGFTLAGKAVAGYDDASGKVELEVYNPQGSDGKEIPPFQRSTMARPPSQSRARICWRRNGSRSTPCSMVPHVPNTATGRQIASRSRSCMPFAEVPWP
jgi:hypothetical protein